MIHSERLSELIITINRGSQEAYATFIELTQEFLIKTAYNYLGDIMLAEDIVNEFYCELPQKCKKMKNMVNVAGWSKTIVINKSLNLINRRKREISTEYMEIKKLSAFDADAETENMFVREILAKMKENERLILLYRANGYTLQEITMAMNLTMKKVRVLLERAKKNFIRFYEEYVFLY